MQLKRFPDDVLERLRVLSDQVVAEIAQKDAASKKVYESYKAFRTDIIAWDDVAERAYLNARGEG